MIFLDSQILELPFYSKVDFYIFFFLGAASLVFSIMSATEARRAKKAAENAGRIVKIQDILLDIPEIINLCRVELLDDFQKANTKISAAINKINLVLGVLGKDIQNEDKKAIISEIETDISKVREILKSLNPVYENESSQQIKETDSRIYLALIPYIDILTSDMNRLSGNLHNQMLQNN